LLLEGSSSLVPLFPNYYFDFVASINRVRMASLFSLNFSWKEFFFQLNQLTNCVFRFSIRTAICDFRRTNYFKFLKSQFNFPMYSRAGLTSLICSGFRTAAGSVSVTRDIDTGWFSSNRGSYGIPPGLIRVSFGEEPWDGSYRVGGFLYGDYVSESFYYDLCISPISLSKLRDCKDFLVDYPDPSDVDQIDSLLVQFGIIMDLYDTDWSEVVKYKVCRIFLELLSGRVSTHVNHRFDDSTPKILNVSRCTKINDLTIRYFAKFCRFDHFEPSDVGDVRDQYVFKVYSSANSGNKRKNRRDRSVPIKEFDYEQAILGNVDENHVHYLEHSVYTEYNSNH